MALPFLSQLMPQRSQPEAIGDALSIHFSAQQPYLDQPQQLIFSDQFRDRTMSIALLQSCSSGNGSQFNALLPHCSI